MSGPHLVRPGCTTPYACSTDGPCLDEDRCAPYPPAMSGFGPGSPEWCPNAPEDDPGHCGHWYDCEPCHRCGDDTPSLECDCDRCTKARSPQAMKGGDRGWGCVEPGCDAHPANPNNVGPIHRLSPKGQPFVGACPAHFAKHDAPEDQR